MDKKYKEVEILLNEALNIYPQNTDLLYNMAYVMEASEKYEEALEYYKGAFDNCVDEDLKNDLKNNVDNLLKITKKDCDEFILKAGELLNELNSSKAGHLFWLNRNGHGTGFWDEESLNEETRESLSKLSETFGECYVLVNEDDELDIESC